MERNLPRDRSISLRKKAVISTILAASLATGIKLDTQSRELYEYTQVPINDFTPVIVYDKGTNQENLIPHSNLSVNIPPSEKPTLLPEPNWLLDPEISFYGPGFYGNKTACGLTLTTELKGVANRDLPCGTMVTFNWEGMTRTFPVVDRGPYVDGRIFDLTGAACMDFKTEQFPKGHCLTGPINYVIEYSRPKQTNRFGSKS